MRIKNKEIRARRHRKEDKIKDAARELRAKYGTAKTGGADKVVAKKTAGPKPAAKAAPKKTDAAAKPAAKKPATPKAKKPEPATE